MTRAERRQDTRRRLLDAAEDVFARKGFHGASVEDVAAAAGFTQGAVYSNFDSKGDLFVAVIDDRIARQASEVEQAQRAEPDDDEAVLDRLAEHARRLLADQMRTRESLFTLEFVLHAVRERPDLRAALAERYRETDARLATMIRAWQPTGGEAVLSADDLALAHSALAAGLAVRLLVDPEGITPERAVRVMQGLFVERGPP